MLYVSQHVRALYNDYSRKERMVKILDGNSYKKTVYLLIAFEKHMCIIAKNMLLSDYSINTWPYASENSHAW